MKVILHIVKYEQLSDLNIPYQHLKVTGINADTLANFEESAEWQRISRRHLQKHPFCIACGHKAHNGKLVVHHKLPFDLCITVGRIDLLLDDRNLMTLCTGAGSEEHHLLLGHLNDWASYNPEAFTDARTTFFQKTKAFICSNETWKHKIARRPKHLKDLNEAEIVALREKLDMVYPQKIII